MDLLGGELQKTFNYEQKPNNIHLNIMACHSVTKVFSGAIQKFTQDRAFSCV